MENLKKLESKYVNKLKNYLTKIFKITRKNEMRILPGNIAFFIMLSIVPAITLAGVIGVHFTDSFSQVINFINLTLPKGVSSILLSFLENAVVKNYNVFVYLLLGFIIASNGANSIIIASNTLYDVENKNYVFRRIKAFFLTIMLMLLFIFILIGLAFSNVIYRTLADLNLILFNKQILFLYNFFKWPFAFFYHLFHHKITIYDVS